MAREIKIKLEVLDAAKNAYDTEISNLERAIKDLDESISILKSQEWNTVGSQLFFQNYDLEWLPDFTDHLDYLKHLRDCLYIAQKNYHAVYEARI